MHRFRVSLSKGTKLALAVGAVFFLAEARAAASCSDHTAFSFAPFAQDSTSTGSGTRQTPANPSTGPQRRQSPCQQCPASPFEAPCRGPGCSGNNLPEGVPISTAKINVTQDQWDLTLFEMHIDAHDPIGWLALGQLVLPVSRTDAIFHPPRHG